MSETHVFLKYDGTSKALQAHRIEAKQLGEALIELADLIYDANTTLNGVDSFIDVQAQAGFIEGSFGLELIIDQNIVAGTIEVAKYVGLGSAAVAGSLLSVLKNKGNREPDLTNVVIDEQNGTATLTIDDEKVETTPEVIELLKSRVIRRRVSKIVSKPLQSDGIDTFIIMEDAVEQKPLFQVDKDEEEFFKEPPRKKSETVDELETVATIEFIRSNKESGDSGWRMRHLGKDVAVKIKDDVFLAAILKENEPSIYGHKYSVDLHYKKNVSESGEREIFTITKVRSRVRERS
jgi:hypothetical protein